MAADNALGEFLKARRGRVPPSHADLPAHGRRRVAGLRRDELAQLAGISEPYLTRLEQGVDRHPSPQVLRALARALELDADASAHLFTLAGPGPVRPSESEVTPDVHQLLDGWTGTPVYVRNRRFDVLAANKWARALAPMYEPGHNLARDMFLVPGTRRLFPDWPEIAARTAAALRAEADPRDPRTARLVAGLKADDDFRSLWARHDARPSRDELKRFVHPVVGELALRRQALTVGGAEQQVIIVYQAVPESPSASALSRLLRHPALTPGGDSLSSSSAWQAGSARGRSGQGSAHYGHARHGAGP
ncbi:helix-turn-helix transcriptional regulator [Streptomyces caniferus]|uniref:helix-turn-helix domain-containing protein n=1 Tax=Streptomyces caniferus TaxID=285557 RepID=UPI002E28FED3|nr:helix-turn-helix transcriptional regulator [Streptomyces caniferus]